MMLTPNQVSINYFMDQLNIQLKVCSKCKESLFVEKFHKDSTKKDELDDKCKSCRAQYYQDNKPKICAQQREYNQGRRGQNKIINLEREKTTYFEDIKDNPKKCTLCKQIKTCAEFNRDIKTKDGLSTYCKYCDTQASIDRIVKLEKDDPNFKLVRRFQQAFSTSLKQGEVIRALKTLMKRVGIKSIQELTGVKTIQMARKILLKTIPQGYTEQDWIDSSLHTDHKEPLSYFTRFHGDNLKLALVEANQITNLRLITAKDNLRKHNSYALMPNNTKLLYEDWVKTRGIKING
jgi:hypothetical protein